MSQKLGFSVAKKLFALTVGLSVSGCSSIDGSSTVNPENGRRTLGTPYVEFIRSGGIAGGATRIIVKADGGSSADDGSCQVITAERDCVLSLIAALNRDGMFLMHSPRNANRQDDVRLELLSDDGVTKHYSSLYKSTAWDWDWNRLATADIRLKALSR